MWQRLDHIMSISAMLSEVYDQKHLPFRDRLISAKKIKVDCCDVLGKVCYHRNRPLEAYSSNRDRSTFGHLPFMEKVW